MFIVFACDGIYDVMTNEELVEFVLNQLKVFLCPDSLLLSWQC